MMTMNEQQIRNKGESFFPTFVALFHELLHHIRWNNIGCNVQYSQENADRLSIRKMNAKAFLLSDAEQDIKLNEIGYDLISRMLKLCGLDAVESEFIKLVALPTNKQTQFMSNVKMREFLIQATNLIDQMEDILDLEAELPLCTRLKSVEWIFEDASPEVYDPTVVFPTEGSDLTPDPFVAKFWEIDVQREFALRPYRDPSPFIGQLNRIPDLNRWRTIPQFTVITREDLESGKVRPAVKDPAQGLKITQNTLQYIEKLQKQYNEWPKTAFKGNNPQSELYSVLSKPDFWSGKDPILTDGADDPEVSPRPVDQSSEEKTTPDEREDPEYRTPHNGMGLGERMKLKVFPQLLQARAQACYGPVVYSSQDETATNAKIVNDTYELLDLLSGDGFYLETKIDRPITEVALTRSKTYLAPITKNAVKVLSSIAQMLGVTSPIEDESLDGKTRSCVSRYALGMFLQKLETHQAISSSNLEYFETKNRVRKLTKTILADFIHQMLR